MSTRREELVRAAKEASANYAFCRESADNARRSLALGFGSIADVTTKTYLESTSYTHWLRASEALIATEPKTATKPRATASAAPAIAPQPSKAAVNEPKVATTFDRGEHPLRPLTASEQTTRRRLISMAKAVLK